MSKDVKSWNPTTRRNSAEKVREQKKKRNMEEDLKMNSCFKLGALNQNTVLFNGTSVTCADILLLLLHAESDVCFHSV